MGQRPDAGDVADRPQPLGHAQPRVDRDAVGVRLDADRLEPDPLDPRTATRRHQQPVAAQLPAVAELEHVVLALTPRHRRPRAEHELDTVAAQHLAERLAQRRGLVREHPLGAAHLEVSAVVLDHRVRVQDVGADLRAEVDVQRLAALLGDLLLALALLELGQPGAQHRHRGRAVGRL